MPTEPRALRILWISDFPIEYLPDAPAEFRDLPKQHALSWQRVLFDQLAGNPAIELHIAILRKVIPRHTSFRLRGVTIHLRRMPGFLRAPSLFWIDTWVVRKLVKSIRPEILHAWGSERGAALVAGRLGLPFLATVQGLMQWYAELVPLAPYERFAALLERYSLPRASLVTSETPHAVRYLEARGVRATQVEHAPDPMFFHLSRRPKTAPPRLLFIGSFCFRKGGDMILGALDKLRDLPWEFVVAGSMHPEMRAQWEACSASFSAGRLQFIRNLTPAAVADEISTACLELLPTRADTSPNAVKEAVVAGLPVIGTRIGGLVDYVHEGQNGFLVESGNQAEFTAAVRKGLLHPLFSQGQVESSTLAKVRAYLSPELMRDKFLAAYHQVKDRSLSADAR